MKFFVWTMKFFVWCRASANDRRGYEDSVAHAYSDSLRSQLYGICVAPAWNAPVSEWVAACNTYENQILGGSALRVLVFARLHDAAESASARDPIILVRDRFL